MKQLDTSTALFLVAAAMVASTSPAVARDRQAEAEIRKIEYAVMTCRTGEEIEKYLDPDTVIWDVTGQPANGVRATVDHLTRAVQSPQWNGYTATLIKDEVRADKELAWAYSLQHVTVVDKEGKVFFDSDFRVTNVYRKINGKWLIASQHLSFPVDMKTSKGQFGKLDAGFAKLKN